MKKNKIIMPLLISLSACCLIGCNNDIPEEEVEETYPITLKKLYDGKSTSTLEPTISRYLRNYDNDEYLAEALHNRIDELNKNGRSRYDYQTIKIEWEDTGKNEEYTIHVADNKEFNHEFTYTTKETSISNEIGIFVPQVTYYYKVVGSISGSSKVDSFVSSSQVRYISADTTINVRDLGGWKTVDGKTLNYGKIYRGGALDEAPNASYLSDKSRKVFDYLGIRGEIDLRGNDIGGQESVSEEERYLNKINNSYPILRDGLAYFAYEQMTTDEGKARNNLPKIFKFLGDKSNYPVYFHCSVGADRTGTLGFILESLLGVEFRYSMIDYELTSFTTDTAGGIRSRTQIKETNEGYTFATPSVNDLNTSYFKLAYAYELLMKKYESYSTLLPKVMERYLLDMGVSKKDIDTVKSIMLG